MARRNKKTQATQAAKSVPVTPVAKAVVPVAAPKKVTPAPVYPRLSEEKTPYGTLTYRQPVRANQFTGTQGSPQEALILDIDGTMQGWGGGLDKVLHDWCAGHYKRNPDIVFIVITARDHEYDFERSFNWVMRDFPYAFIGPFCRAIDDPRLASEFKRHLAVMFEEAGVYRIVGAADDNTYVNQMWAHWKATRNPEFDHLVCDAYASYGGWRSALGSKGKSWGAVTSTPAKVTGTTPATPAKNRPAGTSHYAAPKATEVSWQQYVATRPPAPLPTREDLEDQAHHANPHWTPEYLASLDDADLREAVGITNGDYRQMLYDQIAYLFGSHACDDELDQLELAEIEPMLDMTADQISAVLDARLAPPAPLTEEQQRRNARMDLEDLAVHLVDGLTLIQAMALDTAELQALIDGVDAEAQQLNAGEVAS